MTVFDHAHHNKPTDTQPSAVRTSTRHRFWKTDHGDREEGFQHGMIFEAQVTNESYDHLPQSLAIWQRIFKVLETQKVFTWMPRHETWSA